MGERARKRKSLWDMGEESKPHAEIRDNNGRTGKERHANYGRSHYHEWPASDADDMIKSKDYSGWQSWRPAQDDSYMQKGDGISMSREGLSDMKEVGAHSQYYQRMSPTFDRGEHRSSRHVPDYGGERSLRYMERSRNRSRSRGRDRSRSHSGGRDRSKDWSRSRSRSRSRSKGRGKMRSRSPFGHNGRESFGWGERRSGAGMSSQICREFSAGRCSRGGQCRFLHPDNLNSRDGTRSESEPGDRWRKRLGHGRDDKVSDPYHREDETIRNRSRSTVPCKDFMRGKCNWGEACRFAHHSAENNYDKGVRNAYSDHVKGQQSSKSEVPLCKFFAAGNCHRDNCRFSHDGPTSTDFEHKQYDDVGSHILDGNNKWSGPSWDNATEASNTAKTTGWGDSSVWNPTAADAMATEPGNRLERNAENDSRTWEILERNPHASETERSLLPHDQGGTNIAHIGTSEPSFAQNLVYKQDSSFFHPSSLSQNREKTDTATRNNGQGLTKEAVDQHLSTILRQPLESIVSSVQQHHGQAEEILVTKLDFGSSTNVIASGTQPVLVPDESSSRDGENMSIQDSWVLNETNQSKQSPLQNSLNAHSIDLNRPQHMCSFPNLETRSERNQNEAVKPPEVQEFIVPRLLPGAAPIEKVAQIISSAGFLSEKFANELQSQLCATTKSPKSGDMIPPPSSACPPPMNPTDVQLNLVTFSLDQQNRSDDGPKPVNSSNGNDNRYYSTEQIQMPLGPSPSSKIDSGSGNLPQSGDLTVQNHTSPELKQLEMTSNSQVISHKQNVREKEGKEKVHAGIADAHGKVDGSGSRDEKEMRLFKNALVEFVKEILKPTWKEGRMSREVHKSVVKKVVDKVTGAIQGDHIPKTQEKIDQYLSHSKSKITKLVQAYVERSLKSNA